MGCSCKQRNKIIKSLTNQNTIQNNNSINEMFQMVWGSLMDGISRLLIVLLFVMMTPVVIVILGINFLIKGDMNIGIPKSLYKMLEQNE